MSSKKIVDVYQAMSEAGGTLRFGKGIMGKSSIIIVFLIFLILAFVLKAPWWAGGIAVLIAISVFIFWFNQIIKFSIDHPDIALLEGAEWTTWSISTMQQKGGKAQLIQGHNIELVNKQAVTKEEDK